MADQRLVAFKFMVDSMVDLLILETHERLDSAEADAIRQAMDERWKELTAEDHAWLRALSARLDTYIPCP